MSEASHPLRLIVGLGNPGEEYAATYHNAGKLLVEYISEKAGARLAAPSHKRFSSAKTGHDVLITLNSFMNTSGGPVVEALKFFEAAPGQLLIAHDDSDLPLGSYKYVIGGGSAGHHGIDSIVEAISESSFPRLRIGIRDPQEAVRKKAGDFVLGQVSAANRKILYGVFDEIIENVIEKDTPLSSVAIS